MGKRNEQAKKEKKMYVTNKQLLKVDLINNEIEAN